MKPVPRPPNWKQGFSRLVISPDKLMRLLGDQDSLEMLRRADSKNGYLHWERFRHLPMPEGISAEDGWAWVSNRRSGGYRPTGFTSKTGDRMHYVSSDPLLAALRRVDTHEGLLRPLSHTQDTATYRLRAAIEEAFYSGRLEGADTQRSVAREMLRSGRLPRDRSERMILNNFHTLEKLEHWRTQELSPELLCEIQATVTEGTLEKAEDVGRIRRDDEVKVFDRLTGETIHQPPPWTELEQRVQRLCKFANEDGTDEEFLHPILKAILLHYQLAYDHPFGDGNGRTARALFLWKALRHPEYDWFRFLPISRATERSKEAYYRSFLYVESTEFDVTYFVRHQLDCIEQEIAYLGRFLQRRETLRQRARERFRLRDRLNARQLALLEYALEHPGAQFRQVEHAQYHGVTTVSAGRDLNEMVEIGLLVREKAGKEWRYRATAKLQELKGD